MRERPESRTGLQPNPGRPLAVVLVCFRSADDTSPADCIPLAEWSALPCTTTERKCYTGKGASFGRVDMSMPGRFWGEPRRTVHVVLASLDISCYFLVDSYTKTYFSISENSE